MYIFLSYCMFNVPFQTSHASLGIVVHLLQLVHQVCQARQVLRREMSQKNLVQRAALGPMILVGYDRFHKYN